MEKAESDDVSPRNTMTFRTGVKDYEYAAMDSSFSAIYVCQRSTIGHVEMPEEIQEGLCCYADYVEKFITDIVIMLPLSTRLLVIADTFVL